MKKYLIIVAALLALVLLGDALYYRLGVYIPPFSDEPINVVSKIENGQITISKEDGSYEVMEIKGVNMGSGVPGYWSTEFHINKETYLRWFAMIQDMGANVIRIYTILSEDFYNAFYEYNRGREQPLYLIQGVWVNDYVLNSHHNIYDDAFFESFYSHCKTAVDVIHGQKKIFKNQLHSAGYGSYLHDVSDWVLGYIWGVEWEDLTVAYSNDYYLHQPEYNFYQGQYLSSSEDATPFEVMLTMVGDRTLEYETKRYREQRVFAFSNWVTTDPFEYPKEIAFRFSKCARVDTENIVCSEKVLSGQFASYHVYPYYPDYLNAFTDAQWTKLGIGDRSLYTTDDGRINTYLAYLQLLNNHHEMPVLISEFGVSTGRGIAQVDQNTNRNQGHMSEQEQGEALVSCYQDIIKSGSIGGCAFIWQDEWFKRTWNTMYSVDLERTPYWSDYQTNEQYFGLLSFDPGTNQSICYVDGDISEWDVNDIVAQNEDGSSLSMKYDERFVYLMVRKNGFSIDAEKLYIPIDTTQKTGSNYVSGENIKFNRAADFLLILDGKENSRLLVQERYEALRANYSVDVYGFNTYFTENIPEKDSPIFRDIYLALQLASANGTQSSIYHTGLLTYGNANPSSNDFNSLADFMAGDGFVEIKLPWQLLNFMDPSRMMIHDDYYEHYGVEGIALDRIYVGIGNGTEARIEMQPKKMKGWDTKVTYHERLKESYYILQSFWKQD